MSQGHVSTTDHNGRPLMLLFLIEDQEDADEFKKDLNNQVEVLRGFATKWNQGVKDNLGRNPLSPSQPCTTLCVLAPQHESIVTPQERDHITVQPSSSTMYSVPYKTTGVVHVYSVDDDTSKGFHSYYILRTKTQTFNAALVSAINTAKENLYTQSVQRSGDKADSV